MRHLRSAVRLALISVCAILLSACSSGGLLSPKAPDLNKQIDMTAQVSYGSESFTARFVRTGIGQWQITVNEPYETEGITFTYNSGAAGAVYGEIEVPELTADFAASPLMLLIGAIEDTVQDGAAEVVYLDNTYQVKSGECVITFNQNESVPVGIELSQSKITASVTEFSIIGDIFQNNADVVLIH